MENRQEICAVMRQRANLYRFLSRIYILEADEKLLAQMKQMSFPEEPGDADLRDGYARLKEYLAGVHFSGGEAVEAVAANASANAESAVHAGTEKSEKIGGTSEINEASVGNAESGEEEIGGNIAEKITELEVEYARIFLAAGVAQGTAAFPYESVYTNKKHLVNQEACDDLTALYAAKGLKPREDMYRIPDDHAGLEFEYMARLCDTAVRACEADDEAALEESVREQKTFFEHHLRRWVSLFGGDIAKHAQTAFFDGIGRITRGFMVQETAFLK
ncbi:MAG: molecular chaperone TorD family protein [Lachnospiraceae bacterium]|nr:molecular chaperone TorD family protein [Lachnospiraceae bacterium]